MWLYIFENGEVKKSDVEPCDGDMDAADSGILDLIDIKGQQPLQYAHGKWHGIDDATTES
jgi:hypothetical protein